MCIQDSRTESADALWYHAPDLLLRVSEVTSAADMWSAGCIIAEMLIGQPLFRGVTLNCSRKTKKQVELCSDLVTLSHT